MKYRRLPHRVGMDSTHRSVISLDDLGDDDLRAVVSRGVRYSRGELTAEPLAGRSVGIHFQLTSTRTRTAFSVAALRLGARTVAFGPDELQLRTGESTADTARVFARMLDLLVMRSNLSITQLREWADPEQMAVVNAMSVDEHPTQALADLTTMARRFGAVEQLRVLYVGEGNNTAAALALALSRFPGADLQLRTPPGYGLDADVAARAGRYAARSGATFAERHDMADADCDADVVYTTRWCTTGTQKPDPDWRRTFQPFQVTTELLKANPSAVLMHDLPAHRGDEITAEALDGPASIVFDQAENKLHSAVAVLEWCLGGYR